MRSVPRAEADHRNRKRFGEHLTNLGRRYLAHDRETAGIDHRPCIVDQRLRAVRSLALREESSELRHAHRRDADMALHRDPGLDDRFDVLGVVLVAFAFHDFCAALRDVFRGVIHRLHFGEMKAHVRHIHHA